MTAEWTRLFAMAALLVAGTLFAVACGDGATTETQRIALRGTELRDFVGTLLITRQEIPGALEDAPGEEWRTESPDVSGEPFAGLGLEGTGWLGTLSRPIIVSTPQGRTVTVGNTASVFETASGAADALDFLKETDVDEMGENLVASTPATSYEVKELEVIVGEDAWALLLAGPAEVEGAQEDLILAMVGFRRGPIVAVVSTLGFVEFGEALVGQLARTLDERIQAGLEGL